MPKSLIIGCGYVGRRVAQQWRDDGHDLTVVTRTAETATQLAADGYTALVADVMKPSSLAALPGCDTLLYAVGYSRESPESIREVYAGGLRNVVQALSPTPRRIIYLSSTGVYGPADGGWVDETSAVAPERDGGVASLAAEEELQHYAPSGGAIVLRLAGIYGPGRVPHLNRIRNGEPILVPAASYLNLIHVVDAAAAVVAAAKLPGELIPSAAAPRVYCVSDGCPVTRNDFYGEVARLIGRAPPEFQDPPSDSAVAQRASGNRRVSNARMLRELPFALTYPNFRLGLQSILTTSTQ